MHSLLKISKSPLNEPPPLEVLLSLSSRKIYHDNDETHACHPPSDMVWKKIMRRFLVGIQYAPIMQKTNWIMQTNFNS